MKSENTSSVKGIIALTAVCAVALSMGMTRSASADLLSNGGFETQGAGDATTAAGWNLNFGGGIAPTNSIRDTNKPLAGSFDLHLTVTGSSAANGPAANALSTFNVGDPALVTPGVVYTLKYNTVGTFGPGAVLNTFIDWYDGNGALLARNLKEVDATSSASYISHTDTDTAPANAVYFDAFFNFVTGAFDGASGDISIDNASFNPPGGSSPEPASLSLLACGVVGLVARRRR
jgi:hypothetical protein